MITCRDYWRVMNGGYLDNPHFSFRARTFHESLAATLNMDVLSGVLGCSFDRLRTGSPCDVSFRYASEPIPRYRGTSCQVAQPSSWSRDSNS